MNMPPAAVAQRMAHAASQALNQGPHPTGVRMFGPELPPHMQGPPGAGFNLQRQRFGRPMMTSMVTSPSQSGGVSQPDSNQSANGRSFFSIAGPTVKVL